MEKVTIEGIVKEFEKKGGAFVEDDWTGDEKGEDYYSPQVDTEGAKTWLREKLTDLLTSLEKEIKGIKLKNAAGREVIGDARWHYQEGYNESLGDALSIVRSYKK